MTVVYCYSKCSTCTKALRWLDGHKIPFESRPIADEPPTKEQIRQAIEKSGLPLKRFFNTSGGVYREGNYRDKVETMTLDDAADALAQNGMLIKRPLVIAENFVLVGFKEDEWQKAFQR